MRTVSHFADILTVRMEAKAAHLQVQVKKQESCVELALKLAPFF